jgi:uncharacterized protein YdhG (YjbR/CyaY superfamily)
MKKASKKSRIIEAGGVDEYITRCPKDVQIRLQEIRAAIREVAPDAIETVSYFDMPGYSYEGYVYNGMFAWFSFKTPFVRLHVRPVAIESHKRELEKFATTRAIISFPTEAAVPKTLVKKLVKASLQDMKNS